MKFSIFVLISLVLISCGATVATDFEKDTNFSVYKTYNYFPELQTGLSELDDNRIIAITDSILSARGFSKSENPQLLINFYANEVVTNSRNTIGIGFGSGGGNVGVGVSGGLPIGGKVVEQKFTMDFVDAANDNLIWQAVLEDDYKEKAKPEQKIQYYESVVSKILSKYPPDKR